MNILIFDLMDTVVDDPFLKVYPQFLGVTQEELFAIKNMDSWPAFELGEIDEQEYFRRFFRPGITRALPDVEQLKNSIFNAYQFVSGMEALLIELQQKNFSLWVHSNYTEWVNEIRVRLQLDRFFKGYAISYELKARKPDALAYTRMLQLVGASAQDCIFIDDRKININAAQQVGLNAIQFINSEQLREQLIIMGLKL